MAKGQGKGPAAGSTPAGEVQGGAAHSFKAPFDGDTTTDLCEH